MKIQTPLKLDIKKRSKMVVNEKAKPALSLQSACKREIKRKADELTVRRNVIVNKLETPLKQDIAEKAEIITNARPEPMRLLRSASKLEIISKAAELESHRGDFVDITTSNIESPAIQYMPNQRVESFQQYETQGSLVNNRKPNKGDRVKVLYEEDGWNIGIIIGVGRGKKRQVITVELNDGTIDTMEYDGVDVVLFDDIVKSPPRATVLQPSHSSVNHVDVSIMKVVELRKECVKYGLKTDGKKSDLIFRLKSFHLGLYKGGDASNSECSLMNDVGTPLVQSGSIKRNFSLMKVAELRSECSKRKISATGSKDDLVSRLVKDPIQMDSHNLDIDESPYAEETKGTHQEVDFSGMKVVELRKQCAKRGLKTAGLRKADLVSLLLSKAEK